MVNDDGSARRRGTDVSWHRCITDVVHPQYCTWLRIGAWPTNTRNTSHADAETHIKVSILLTTLLSQTLGLFYAHHFFVLIFFR